MSPRVIFATSPERHTGRSLRFRWLVDSFIRTGCIRNVAWRWIIAATLRSTIQPHRLYSKRGGRLVAAPTCVIPFNRTGYIRQGASPCRGWLLGSPSGRAGSAQPRLRGPTLTVPITSSFNKRRKALSVTYGDNSPRGRAKVASSVTACRFHQSPSSSDMGSSSGSSPLRAAHCSLVIRMARGLEPWKGPTMPFSSISSTIRAARA